MNLSGSSERGGLAASSLDGTFGLLHTLHHQNQTLTPLSAEEAADGRLHLQPQQSADGRQRSLWVSPPAPLGSGGREHGDGRGLRLSSGIWTRRDWL